MPIADGTHLIMNTKVEHVFHSSEAPDLRSNEGSKPEITSSKAINAQGNTDENRIPEIELKQSGSRRLVRYFHNKDCEKTRGESCGTNWKGEQAECRDGIQSSNFRAEWSSLEVLYSDIKVATNNLSESSKIGKGGYGSVYKAKLGGTTVAIKILDSTSEQGQQEFFQELEVLHEMRHPNLVKLVGVCFKVQALVYEYLPNRSLEDCLKDNPNLLTWQMRTRIIYEICLALIHLHSKSVVHGDLKPANILLDANFKSKLSDFGLCRVLPKDMSAAAYLETIPKGTSGYIDPWFLETCILRTGSDLYSFGITTLKLLTGMPPLGLGRKMCVTDESSLWKMIDPTAGSWPIELAKELVYWSLQCCYHNENSSALLLDMSTCLEDMLAEIETLQEGRFKPRRTIQYGARGLDPPSHIQDGEKRSSFPLYSYSEIMGATNGFSELSKIGVMKYGSIYKGELGGTVVAIMRLDSTCIQGNTEFFRLLNVVNEMRHPGLVKLLGASLEARALVYEFLPKGSLQDWLEKSPGRLITWTVRTCVILGICLTLKFLHSRSMVHSYAKPANFDLLDVNFDVKPNAYFDTAPEDTVHYMDPLLEPQPGWVEPLLEPETGRILGPYSDVHSFGVRRLSTRQQPVGLSKNANGADENLLPEMIDPNAGHWLFEEVYCGLRRQANEESLELAKKISTGPNSLRSRL